MTKKFSRDGLLETQVLMLFCIDTSGSLQDYEDTINEGIVSFFDVLKEHPEAENKTEVGFITFDTEVNEPLLNFTKRIKKIPKVKINPNGLTNMGDAIIEGIDLVMKRYRELRNNKERVFIPYLVLFTDGIPCNRDGTADQRMQEAIKKLNQFEGLNEEGKYQIHFLSIGVGNVDKNQMKKISIMKDRFIMLDNISDLSKSLEFVCSVTMNPSFEIESLNLNEIEDKGKVKMNQSKVVEMSGFTTNALTDFFKRSQD